MQMLTDEMVAEVVAYDRRRREAYKRRTGEKMRRTTERYNYIVPCDGKCKSLSEVLGYGKPERPKEVCIVNVAVKPGHDDVPVVREVVWMWPESCKIEIAGCRFLGMAGWLVEWAWKDLKPRKGKPATDWRRALYFTSTTQVFDWRYNLDGLTRAYDATVNPEALQGTRYKYCQYVGGGHCGLMDWLTLYRMEPKVELLAKAGLRRCVCPAGLKALKDRKVFDWVIENKATLARSKNWNVRDLLYAARHGVTIKKAKDHFETVRELSRKLDSMRWNLRIADDYCRPVKLKLDYERLAKLLPKWGVDACEYGRYVEHAKEAGLDLRNEGTLYPPVTGGRKAFMHRLEELEANAAKMKAAEIDKAMSERAPEIAAFQESVERTKTLYGCGYKIVLAKTQGELLAEGKRMGNCIGNGVYGRGIATGHKLIVMLKLPGVRGAKSYCDIEIDRHTWKVRQCYTKGNRIPPDEVRELANRIAAFLKAEYKRQQRKAKKGKAA